MKKIITILFVFLLLAAPAFAEESSASSAEPSPSMEATPVAYVLPYPGLLPGNPLYYLKVARDKIIDFFITDPDRKAKFYLLQADKHLEGGILLWNQKRYEDSELMISKGENYLDMSLGKTLVAKEAGENTDEILMNLTLSSMKHQEVIKDLAEKAPPTLKDSLKIDLQKAKNIQKRLDQFRLQKKANK